MNRIYLYHLTGNEIQIKFVYAKSARHRRYYFLFNACLSKKSVTLQYVKTIEYGSYIQYDMPTLITSSNVYLKFASKKTNSKLLNKFVYILY